jgi:hypothetical protein
LEREKGRDGRNRKTEGWKVRVRKEEDGDGDGVEDGVRRWFGLMDVGSYQI